MERNPYDENENINAQDCGSDAARLQGDSTDDAGWCKYCDAQGPDDDCSGACELDELFGEEGEDHV